MTIFGEAVTPEAIARGLSTVPRWNGRTVLDRVGRQFSVLQHTLVVSSLVSGPVVQLYALLHDAEETVVGDTPRNYKSEGQIELGRKVRADIFAGLKVPVPEYSGSVWQTVKEADNASLAAEAYVLVHPREREFWAEGPDMHAVDQVWGVLDLTPRMAIEQYVHAVEALFEAPAVKQLRSRS